MKTKLYKLGFPVGAHFGQGMLNDSAYTFRADVLFSALYIEARKIGEEDRLYEAARTGRLLFSDALPYVGDCFMLPKPMVYVEPVQQGNSDEKKKYKKLKYIPVERIEEYLKGNMNADDNPMKDFGRTFDQTKASVRTTETETLPYHVGAYYYKNGNGLYIIVRYQDDALLELTEKLLKSLSYVGIGGKKASGLGRFELKDGECELLERKLDERGEIRILLSTALPRETEMKQALEGASYLLEKRSGFVASETYAEEYRKKKDLYVFAAGSCFRHAFDGDVYDVSNGGRHPVYRYAKSMFLEVMG